MVYDSYDIKNVGHFHIHNTEYVPIIFFFEIC